ncbi:MAG: hypothetical protein V4723_04200 [Pseudomonadota bacterium]
MGNRAYLLNTSILTSDMTKLDGEDEDGGFLFADVAETGFKIPVPWLRCFRPADLQTVLVELDEPGTYFKALLPCTTVQQAVDNLQRSAPIFFELAGDAKIGQEYLDIAIKEVRALPRPYLTMSLLEVVFGNIPGKYIEDLVTALGDDARAIECLKSLSFIQSDAVAYPPDVLQAVSANYDHDRMNIATALSTGIYQLVSSDDANATERRPVAHAPNTLVGMLDEINLLLTGKLDHVGYPICTLELSRMQQMPNGLKLVLIFDTEAQRLDVVENYSMQQAFNGGFEPRFQALATSYEFDWMGYLISSKEKIASQFRGDREKWKLVTPPQARFQ